MTWGLVAVAGATVVGGIASARAGSKAARAGEKGAERSAAQIQASADRAREDVFDFFPSAQQDLLAGAGAAGNILTQGVGEQQRLLSAGNVGAQGTLGSSFAQQQNALLGLPVDQQAFAAKPIELSQPLQNPLVPQAAPAGQPAGQPASPLVGQPAQGLFSDIAKTPILEDQRRLSESTTNADVLTKVLSGELDIPGVDTDMLELMLRSSGFGKGSGLLRMAQENDPAVIDDFIKRTIPNVPDLQEKLRPLIAGLTNIFNA